MEKENLILQNLFQGLTQEAAIVLGAERVSFQDVWDMPDRHDLNRSKGHYLIPVMSSDGSGGITTHLYSGAAFGDGGLIGRWARKGGNHWNAAVSTAAGSAACKELYEAMRGGDFRFKSVFAWNGDVCGPEKIYKQLGEGIEVLLLDTLSSTPCSHGLRSRAFHDRIRAKANAIIDAWDATLGLGFKIGGLPSRPADHGCNNAHPMTQGASGIFQGSTSSCSHCGILEKDQGVRINEHSRWCLPGKGPLCVECTAQHCPAHRLNLAITPSPAAPLATAKLPMPPMAAATPAAAQVQALAQQVQPAALQMAEPPVTDKPGHWQYSPAVPVHLRPLINAIALYSMFISDNLTCHNCGGQPRFMPSWTIWGLDRSRGQPTCGACKNTAGASSRLGRFFEISQEEMDDLVQQRSMAIQPANQLLNMTQWYRQNPATQRGHARCYGCKLPEEQCSGFCVREIGYESGRFEPFCPKCTMSVVRMKNPRQGDKYREVPLSQNGILSWVFSPGQQSQRLQVPLHVQMPRCSGCKLPGWVAKKIGVVLNWTSASQRWNCSAQDCSHNPGKFAYLPDQDPASANLNGPWTIDEWRLLQVRNAAITCSSCGSIEAASNPMSLDRLSRQPMCHICRESCLIVDEESRRCTKCGKPNWVHVLQHDGLQLASGAQGPECSNSCSDTRPKGSSSPLEWSKVPDSEPVPPYQTAEAWVRSHPEWAGDDRKCGLCSDPRPERRASGRLSIVKVFYNPLADLALCSGCNARVPCPDAAEIRAERIPNGLVRRQPLLSLPKNVPSKHKRTTSSDEDLDEDSDDEPLLGRKVGAKVKHAAMIGTEKSLTNKRTKMTGRESVLAAEGDDELAKQAKALAKTMPLGLNQGHRTTADKKNRQYDAFLDTYQVREIVQNPNPGSIVLGSQSAGHHKAHYTEASLKALFTGPRDKTFKDFVMKRVQFYTAEYPKGVRFEGDGGPPYDKNEFSNKAHPGVMPNFMVMRPAYRQQFLKGPAKDL